MQKIYKDVYRNLYRVEANFTSVTKPIGIYIASFVAAVTHISLGKS